jgi:soluble lytic murein transglycosylase-like protein
LPLCLAHLTAPPAQPVRPPLLAAAEMAKGAEIPKEIDLTTETVQNTLEPPSPSPAPPVDNLEAMRRAADLLIEVNAAFGVPRSPYGQLIYDVAIRHSINPHLVAAMIHVESAFNPRAVSRKGACGLMQLLPDTARRFGLRRKGRGAEIGRKSSPFGRRAGRRRRFSCAAAKGVDFPRA